MPGPVSPEATKPFADPAYLSRQAPVSSPAGEGPNWMHRVGLPAGIGGTAADVATTLAVLGQGGREMNSRMYGAHPSAKRLIGMSLLTSGLPLELFHLAYDKSKPGSGARKAALLAALGVAGVGAGAAVHNARQLR